MSQVRARVVILEVARRRLDGAALEMEQVVAIFSVRLTTRPQLRRTRSITRDEKSWKSSDDAAAARANLWKFNLPRGTI